MFQHLLVPLDGSPLAEAVLPAVAELGRRAGARITLLHVLEQDAPAEVHGERHLTDAAEAERYLRGVAQGAMLEGLRVDFHVHDERIRSVPGSLVNHAEELAPDLIVLCAHGARRPRDLWFGNIAQQVVRRGLTPVLLLRSDGPTLPFGRILAPLDGRPDHERGLGPAEALARLCAAELELVTVVPTVDALEGPTSVAGSLLPGSARAKLEVAEETAAEYLSELVTRLRQAGLSAKGTVVRGHPADQILAFIRDQTIDCVALGTHGLAGADAFLAGSLAQRLLRPTRVAFLLTPV